MTQSLFTVVTVSIPERYEQLAAACESVRNQTYGPVPHLIRIEQPDTFGCNHVARQRNTILKAVETPYMAVLDDDDTFDPTYLEQIACTIADTESLGGTVDVVYTYCRGTAHAHGEFDPERLQRENYIDGEAVIKTASLIEAHGYPVNDIVEDWQLWRNMVDLGMKFVCLPVPLRTHGRSSVGRNVTN